MDSGDLRLLRLPNEAWGELTAERPMMPPFRYVVGVTGFTRTWRVALVVVATHVVGAVVVRKFGSPGRRQDGLEFEGGGGLYEPSFLGRTVRRPANRAEASPRAR